MTEPYVVEIAVPPTSRSAAVARNFVANLAVEAGWDGTRRVDDLRLVVSELVTNAVQAQPSVRSDDEIIVSCMVFEDRIEITIIDRGGGFDVPDPVPPIPGPDPEREGGFGLPLVALIADRADFHRSEVGIEVRLVMHRNPSGDASQSG